MAHMSSLFLTYWSVGRGDTLPIIQGLDQQSSLIFSLTLSIGVHGGDGEENGKVLVAAYIQAWR